MTDEELKALIANLTEDMAREHKKTEAALASLIEEHKKTEAAQQKTEAALASLLEEHKKTEAAQQKTEAAQQKTEAAQQKTEAAQQKAEAARQEMEAVFTEERKKTEASVRELHKNLGGVGITLGEMTEDLFRRNLESALKSRGILLDSLEHNLKVPDAEFDLVGLNGRQVVLVEVKSRLQPSDIDTLISKQIPTFRRYFNDYKDHKLMGGLASLAIDEKLEKQVEKAGLFLFTQTKEGGASIANSSSFTPKLY